MHKHTHRMPAPRLSRRALLTTACVAAGALAAAPLVSYDALAAPLQTGKPLKIGVLLPQSRSYPTMGRNLLAGMRLALQATNNHLAARPVELVIEDFGFSSLRVVDGAYKLINTAEVDILTGLIHAQSTTNLHALCEQSQTFLLVNNIAATIVSRKAQSPYVFHNGLNYWQANWAMGRHTAQHVGKRAVVVSSFYDAGYDSLFAFRLGYESAGGTILETALVDMPGLTYNAAPHLATIQHHAPDVVYALLSEQMATRFLRDYAQSPLAGQMPLAAGGFTVEDHLLAAQGTTARGIPNGMPWSHSLATAANRTFTAAYQAQTGRTADVFALLGYDSIRMLAQAIESVGGDVRQVHRLSQRLSDMQLDSPRGTLRMNADTGTIESPLYLREVQQHGSTLQNQVLGELEPISELDEAVVAHRDAIVSGWLNPYLAV